MRHLILLISLIVQLQCVSGQNIEKLTRLPKSKGNPNCYYKPTYSTAQRGKFYPFNIADTIKLISFRYQRYNSPIKGDTLITDSLLEIKTLTTSEIDQLTDILYNNFYKKPL